MSLQIAAQHLASKGRGPDTELVHMSMDEIKSLQALAKAHGGSLTINPDTGLAEAGFLSRILPMVAGIGLTAFSGGALSPMMAGLITGGVTGAATGSLKKGLMAGLGAYGGAGLMGGLTGSAGATLAPADQLAAGMGDPNAGLNAMSSIDRVGAGIKGLGTEAGRAGFMQGIGGASGLAKYGGALAAPMLLGGEPAQPPGMKPSAPPVPMQFNANPVSPTPQPDVPVYGQLNQDFGRQQQYFNPTYTIAQQPTTPMPMMADGGPVENMSMRNDMQMMAANGPQMYAGGGLSHLGDYSDGGRLLRGPGDGVSDSIPAMIGQKQPARLADGEFVVPARIVSELGNGSTEAGARKLYAMMDRVQKVRGKTTGKGNVAKNSRAEKYLPA
jgi:hypothetical protein